VTAEDGGAEFAVRTETGRRVVTARGDIDMATAAEFRRHIEAGTEPIVIIDLAAVTYIDSAGIHAIDRSLAALTERHQRVRLVVPTDSPAHWTFKVAGFDPGIFFPSVTDALG
jgi:anti-anti-sigma factor